MQTDDPVALRDYFAAHALTGFIAMYADDCGRPKAEDAAESAYRYADAMLAERNCHVSPDLLSAAQTVLAGLNARIESAPENAVPMFDGIADLHDAIQKAQSERSLTRGP